MKTTIFSFLMVVMMMFSFSAYSVGTVDEPGKKTAVSGKVVDQQTGEHLAGAVVMIKGTNLKAYTDLEGNFSIGNMEPGIYSLEVSFISYKNAEVSNLTLTAGNPSSLEIKVSQE